MNQFLTINKNRSSCSTNKIQGLLLLLYPLLCSTAQNISCPISMTACTLHCKTTAHNSTTTVLQKFSVLQRYYNVHSTSTPRYYNIIGQHPSQYSIVHPGTCSRSSTAAGVLVQHCFCTKFVLVLVFWYFIHSTESALDLTSIAGHICPVFTRSTTVVLSSAKSVLTPC